MQADLRSVRVEHTGRPEDPQVVPAAGRGEDLAGRRDGRIAEGDDAGADPGQASANGAFGRRVANRYGMKTWPFRVRSDEETGRDRFLMDSETARLIKSFRTA